MKNQNKTKTQLIAELEEMRQRVFELKQIEKHYHLINENVSDVIWILDVNLAFTYVSPSIYNQRGYTAKEVLSHTLNETMTPESLEKVLPLLNQKLAFIEAGDDAGWEAVTFGVEQYCQDGTTIWTQNNAKILPGPDGQPASILGVTRDITERMQAEEAEIAAQADLERFETFFASVEDAILVHPMQEKGFAPFIEVNDKACEHYGYTRDEFLKLTAMDITKRMDVEQHAAPDHRQKLLEAGSLVFETTHIKKSGEIFPVEINSNIVEQYGQQVILAVVRDITEQVKADEVVRQQAFESSILFSTSQMLAQAPPDSSEIALIMARQFVDIIGFPEVSIILYDSQDETFRFLIDYYDPADVGPDDESWTGKVIAASDFPDLFQIRDSLEPMVAQISDPNRDLIMLEYMKKSNVNTMAYFPMIVKGHFVGIIELETWFEEYHYSSREISLAMALANQAAMALESAQRYETVQREILEGKQAEESLRESKANLMAIIENTTDSIWTFDTDGEILYVNTVFKEEFQIAYGIQLKPGMNLLNALPDVIRPEWEAYYKRALANERFVFEKKFVFPGNTIYTEIAMNPILSEGEVVGVSCFSRNITVRKEAEEELRHLRNYLSNIIDSMPSTLIGVDAAGIVTQWNSEAQRVSGLLPAEALGQPLEEAIPHLSDELNQVRIAMQTREVQTNPGKTYTENNETRYEDITVYPLVANGVEGAVIRVDDITERVRMQEMMVQSEKMLSVGGLAAGMAHEINNPLAGMMQTADNMTNRLTNMELPANVHAAEKAGVTMDVIHAFMESRGIPRMIATINESGRRVAAIVDNMLSFAPNAETSATTLDMEELLNKAVELASTDYDLKRQYDFKVIEIIKEYGKNLHFVPCEKSKMQQVFLNILRNGAQAMHGVRKQAGARPLRFILRLVHEKEAGVMRIEIEDNGPGMDESTSKRVFEPFFTTKPVDEGTGLGLSVSYFIITENQGGEMEVVSELGQGANFIIRLPLERKKI